MTVTLLTSQRIAQEMGVISPTARNDGLVTVAQYNTDKASTTGKR